jgi:NAD(P)-dependent dehydrogenase (short-subunit alcohol dehydrogenase family)
MKLKGKNALITGAGRGIGKAVALGFAREGCDIVAVARTLDEIETIAAEVRQLGGQAISLRADVSSLYDVQRVAAEVEKRFGKLDVLINNAALRMNHLGKRDSYLIPFAEVTVEDWDRALAVNLRGPFICIKELLPLLRKAGSASIINVSAGGGKTGMAGRSPYCASKFGLEGLTQSLALEFASLNIAVNTISPGKFSILTDQEKIDEVRRNPAAVYMSPAMMVAPMLFLAQQNGASVTGQHVDALQWIIENGCGDQEFWRVKL